MIRPFKRIGNVLLVLFLISSAGLIQAQTTKFKSVYVIADFGQSTNRVNWELQAYVVNDNQLSYGQNWNPDNRNLGPVGLAVDEKNKHLYVSYESSNVLDVFDAATLVQIGQITLPGASNIAGLVVNSDSERLYFVDRGNIDLYVYDSATLARLTNEEFELTVAAMGIDVWDDTIYVTNGQTSGGFGNTISYYSLSNKTLLGSFNISDKAAQAIAVDGSDSNNVLVFTTNTIQSHNNGKLTKYNVNTGVEQTVDIGYDGRGISVNPYSGLVYVACGDHTTNSYIRVYDQDTLTLLDEDLLAYSGWDPTDVLASKVVSEVIWPPLNFTGQKMLNRSLYQAEYINVLTWQANPDNVERNIVKYRIYQVQENQQKEIEEDFLRVKNKEFFRRGRNTLIRGETMSLLVELDASTFEYWHRDVEKNKQYKYAIAAVNDKGREGTPTSIIVQ